MKTIYKKLAIQQLDDVLKKLGPIKTMKIPARGWIRAVRDALGMTGTQLARKLDTNKQRVSRIEQDEKQGRVTLTTMQKAAEALDCVFVYALVPRDSLRQTLERQARRVALKRMSRSNQMMRLEKQELSEKEKQKALDDMVEEILHTMPRTLWDE